MIELKQEKITLAGVLVPDQWTKDGEITELALFTDDEQKYVLDCNAGKDGLMMMLRQNIEVSGIVADDAGERSIIVTAFHLLPS